MDSAHLGTWMSLLYIIAALGWVVGCHMLWTSSTFCPHSKKCPTPHPSLLSLLFPHFSSMLPVHFYLNSDSPFANNYLIVRRSMRWRRLQASLLRLHSDQISWYLSPIGDIFQDPSWHIVPKTALISTQLTYMLFLPYTHIFINLHLFIKRNTLQLCCIPSAVSRLAPQSLIKYSKVLDHSHCGKCNMVTSVWKMRS